MKKIDRILGWLEQADRTINTSRNGLETQEAWRQRGRLIVELMEETGLSREEVLNMVGSPYKKLSKNAKKTKASKQLIVDHDNRLALINFPSRFADPGFKIEFLNFSGDATVESEGWLHRIGPQAIKVSVPIKVTLDDGRDSTAILRLTWRR